MPRRRLLVLALALAALLLAGCGGGKRRRATYIPPPPPSAPSAPDTSTPQARAGGKVLYSEVGLASWYGPPYHNRKAANGEIYDQDAMTAAHRTLPFGSLVRVTNLKTGTAVLVRINDRGPFVPGRVIDLSRAAAKAADVWRPGVAKVRLEVLETPTAIDRGGRWCVQIGAFDDRDQAAELKQQLMRRYSTAKVIQFSGPTGEWVRVRVAQDDKRRAQEVADNTRTSAPVWLVRMD